MKQFSSLLILLLIWNISYSQAKNNDRPKVAIMPFKYSQTEAAAAKQVEAMTFEIFVNSNRMDIVEREFFNDVEREKWRQSQGDFLDGKTIEKTKANGAEFMLIGKIASCNVERITSDKGSVSYHCDLNISVRVVDLETSEVVISDNWKNRGRGLNPITWVTSNSKSEAVQKAARQLEKPIKAFLNDYVPVEAPIIKITDAKGKTAKEVMIGLGSEDGLEEGDRFLVLEVTVVEAHGQKNRFTEEIGELKVTQIGGQHLATAQIKKGGEEVMTKFNEGANLTIKHKL